MPLKFNWPLKTFGFLNKLRRPEAPFSFGNLWVLYVMYRVDRLGGSAFGPEPRRRLG